MKLQLNLLAMICLVATLVGCGSDSSSGGAAMVNGVFVDAAVEGLAFSCGSTTGVTGAGGTFSCPQGSTVTFSVGGIDLCTQTAQTFITPISCAQETDPTANASTASVVAVTRFLMSISTTPASSGTLTITDAARQAAAGLTLDFATAGDVELQAALTAIYPTGTLVDTSTAQAELTTVVNTQFAGSYSGSWTGTAAGQSTSGTWQITIAANGDVTGTASGGGQGDVAISGSLAFGTTFTGTAGTATWTGNLDTSANPAGFSGTWQDQSIQGSGTFTGHHD